MALTKTIPIQHKQTINIAQRTFVPFPTAPVPPVLPLLTFSPKKTEQSSLPYSTTPRKYAPPIPAKATISKPRFYLQKSLALISRVLKHRQQPKHNLPRRSKKMTIRDHLVVKHPDIYWLNTYSNDLG